LIDAVQAWRKYSPDLDITASGNIGYIRCNDCDTDIIVSHENVSHLGNGLRYWRAHTENWWHMDRVKRRLVRSSQTTKRAVASTPDLFPGLSPYWMPGFMCERVSMHFLRLRYYDDCKERIEAFALRSNEKEMLSYLLSDQDIRSPNDHMGRIVRSWAASLDSLDLTKMLLFKGHTDVLSIKDRERLTILDRWVRKNQTAEAIETVNFAALHCPEKYDTGDRLDTALTLACRYGQHEIILAMLEAGGRPNSFALDLAHPLPLALEFAKAASVQVLLEQGSWIGIIDKYLLRKLRGQVKFRHSKWDPDFIPDAEQKLELLDQYGIDWKS
jgi:hypothetical protein